MQQSQTSSFTWLMHYERCVQEFCAKQLGLPVQHLCKWDSVWFIWTWFSWVSAALVAKLTPWCCLLVARGVFVLSVNLYYKLEQGVLDSDSYLKNWQWLWQQCDSVVAVCMHVYVRMHAHICICVPACVCVCARTRTLFRLTGISYNVCLVPSDMVCADLWLAWPLSTLAKCSTHFWSWDIFRKGSVTRGGRWLWKLCCRGSACFSLHS